MDIKRGSVTPVDLTGQADGDYIRNDGGIYKPKTANEVLQDVLFEDVWQNVDVRSGANNGGQFHYTAVGGTGSILVNLPRYLALSTGATAGGTARVSTPRQGAYSIGQSLFTIDWRKIVILKFRCTELNHSSANAKRWLYWGGVEATAVADPTTRGIGIRSDGSAIKGIAHNGAVLTEIDLNTDFSISTLRDILIVSNNGNVEWYVNGVSKGSTALGPDALSNSNENSIGLWVTNGADDVANYFTLHSLQFYVEQ